MQTGHVQCYFNEAHKKTFTSKALASEFATDKLHKGWKVAIEHNFAGTQHSYLTYTVYWGA